MPGACIHDVTKRLPILIKACNYHPFLLLHVGTKVATRKLLNIKRDFISIGKMLKGSGVQVVFSSILPVGYWDPKMRQHTNQVNYCLHSWGHAQGFGLYGLWCFSEIPGMLMPDGAHLMKWGKSCPWQQAGRTHQYGFKLDSVGKVDVPVRDTKEPVDDNTLETMGKHLLNIS